MEEIYFLRFSAQQTSKMEPYRHHNILFLFGSNGIYSACADLERVWFRPTPWKMKINIVKLS